MTCLGSDGSDRKNVYPSIKLGYSAVKEETEANQVVEREPIAKSIKWLFER